MKMVQNVTRTPVMCINGKLKTWRMFAFIVCRDLLTRWVCDSRRTYKHALHFYKHLLQNVIRYKQITVSQTKVEGKWVGGLMSKELGQKGRITKAPLFHVGFY